MSDGVSMNDKPASGPGQRDPAGRQVFRSPGAVAVWWLWTLFAAGNLIDLAVQGRDRLSLVAAFILLFVTGIMYVAAERPRITAGADGLTITNPLRDHHVEWAAVAGADPCELLRVRCEWPDRDGTARRAIYAWAVHSSRRRQVTTEMRARRHAQPQGSRSGSGTSGLGRARPFGAPEPATASDPLRLDVSRVIATLTERAEKARLDTPGTRPAPPVSTWDLTALASIVVPGLALLIIALV
jgi:Bacterial PH domain